MKTSTTVATNNVGTHSETLPGSEHLVLIPTPAKQHRFQLLDALCGVAAVLVATRHIPASTNSFPESFLAVDLFFCLSGFVIGSSYEKRLQTTMTLKAFFLTRLVRLYPLYFLSIVIATLTQVFFVRHSAFSGAGPSLLISIALGLLFLPNLSAHASSIFPLNPPSWSLFFELAANAVYGWMVRLRFANSIVLGATCAVSLALLSVVLTAKGLDFDAGWTHELFLLGFARVGYSFFLGILLFRLYRHGVRVPISGVTAWIIPIVVVLLVVFTLTVQLPRGLRPAWDLLATAILMPLLVFIGANCPVADQWKSLCAFLGDFSYPMYVLHFTLVPFLFFAQLRLKLQGSPLLIASAMIAIIIPVCWWAGKYYDAPVRRFLTSRL